MKDISTITPRPVTNNENDMHLALNNDERLTLMLLVANLVNTENNAKNENMTETLAHGTHLVVLSESYPINANMTGFKWFSKIVVSLCFGR